MFLIGREGRIGVVIVSAGRIDKNCPFRLQMPRAILWIAMKRLFSSFLVIFALVGCIAAGMPLHAGMMDSKMAKCCKKAKGHEQSPSADAARLCCALNCNDPAPTSFASSVNLAPANVNVRDSIATQLFELLGKRSQALPALRAFEFTPTAKSTLPRFIQHHAFLL